MISTDSPANKTRKIHNTQYKCLPRIHMSVISPVTKHTRYLAKSIGQDVLLNSNSGSRNTFLLSACCTTVSHSYLSVPHLGKFANNSSQHVGGSNSTAYPQNISNLSGLSAVVRCPAFLSLTSPCYYFQVFWCCSTAVSATSTSSQSESLDCYQNQFSCLPHHEPRLFY